MVDTKERLNKGQLLSNLKRFTGTEGYYYDPMFPEHRYTDGVRYLAREVGAYWMLQFIFGYCEIPGLEEEAFQTWKLQAKDRSGIFTVTDGNKNILKTLRVPFTDFPLDEIELWLVNKVLILPSEY